MICCNWYIPALMENNLINFAIIENVCHPSKESFTDLTKDLMSMNYLKGKALLIVFVLISVKLNHSYLCEM